MLNRAVRAAMALVGVVTLPSVLSAAQSQSSQPAAQVQTPVRVPGSTVTVTATKEPADPAALPVAVTAVTDALLKSAGVTFIADAGIFSPNTIFTEFTARKLSNPRIRGIGAGPSNPGVVTYVDGVPQLNANTSSLDFIDVGQVEFVRGPQSTLFGRNALGGLINITSTRPSLSKWGGNVAVPFGSDALFETRANVAGPLVKNKLAAGFSLAFSQRDGFSTNTLTGHDLDSREAFSAKGQLLWLPSQSWETRLILSGERARDGDYALNDLKAVRENPFEVQRDFEGFTNRDVFSTAFIARHEGKSLAFTSTTGVVTWKTEDETDLDYTPLPLSTRQNTEEATQFTQEFRFASAAAAPVKLSDRVGMRWQAGMFFFTQGFDQLAVNNIGPFVLSPFINFPVAQTSPDAELDDRGIGLFGQATFALSSKLEATAGVRFDNEHKEANLLTSFDPMIAPPVQVDDEQDFSAVSPQFAVAFRLRPGTMLFGHVSRGYKAGGFNPVSLPGDESYGEEHAWNIEGGVKGVAASGRFSASASVFAIDWDDLQLNLPIPGTQAQFYIDNLGGATSRGVEFEVAGRPYAWLDLFTAVGFARARFADGTSSGSFDISGNKIQNTPAYTASFGAQVSRDLQNKGRLFGRADVAVVGAFEYDELNTQRQDDYALTNFRAGWRGRMLVVEAWMRNAFDTRYVPLAFAFPNGQSGFLAEPGRPRTMGVSFGIGF
jgi:iron complex outermembrane receptor protein